MKKKSILVVLCCLALFAAFRWQKPERPNIVLISIDTLRGDHFTPEYMPKTYAWAQEHATIYKNAQSPSTWTRPSHASMLTGLRPSQHGVETGNQKIADDTKTLAEALREQGYYTTAFVGGAQVSHEWNMQQGFDEWDEVDYRWLEKSQISLLEIQNEHFAPLLSAKNWLSNIPRKPYLLFVHTFGVHEYWMECPRSRITDVSEQTPWRVIHKHWADFTSEKERYAAYIQAVRECDKRLQPLLAALPSDAIVIITSDHGEGFSVLKEIKGHRNPPTIDQTHVPLLVSGLGVGDSNALVTTLDIVNVLTQKMPFPAHQTVCSECVPYNTNVRHIAQISAHQREVYAEPFSPIHNDAPISKETARQLRALGYLN